MTTVPLPQYHRHPDGLVYVRTSGATYSDTEANAATDTEQVSPTLPGGADEQLYILGVSHAYLNRQGIISGGPEPWAYGDWCIANVDLMLRRQAIRKGVQP